MAAARGSGGKWLRLHASAGLANDPPELSRLWVTASEHGFRGGDVVWTLPRECDESIVDAMSTAISARLPEVIAYLDGIADADSFLAVTRGGQFGVHDLISLDQQHEIRQWLQQPCPDVEPVRDAATGYFQLAFADAVLDACAATVQPLDRRWTDHLEAALESARGLAWPSVVPIRDRVTERLTAATNGEPVRPDPRARPVLRIRR